MRVPLAVGLAGVAAGLWLTSRARRRSRHALRGRVVLITGGTRGLGLELARRIGGRGARVVICGRDPGSLERAVADLDQHRVRVLAVRCDVTCPGEVDALLDDVRTLWGEVDVLVNNAGRIEVGPALHMTACDHEAALDLHYRAPRRLIEQVLPAMMRRRRGHVVNLLPHTASKFALTGLSRGQRLELAKHGITVTTVFPGPADALPVPSLSAGRAASRIVRAIERGEHEVVVGATSRRGSESRSGPRLGNEARAEPRQNQVVE